jgi:predicted RNA binding protein with dsRBD fold (UPF0201 family)
MDILQASVVCFPLDELRGIIKTVNQDKRRQAILEKARPMLDSSELSMASDHHIAFVKYFAADITKVDFDIDIHPNANIVFHPETNQLEALRILDGESEGFTELVMEDQSRMLYDSTSKRCLYMDPTGKWWKSQGYAKWTVYQKSEVSAKPTSVVVTEGLSRSQLHGLLRSLEIRVPVKPDDLKPKSKEDLNWRKAMNSYSNNIRTVLMAMARIPSLDSEEVIPEMRVEDCLRRIEKKDDCDDEIAIYLKDQAKYFQSIWDYPIVKANLPVIQLKVQYTEQTCTKCKGIKIDPKHPAKSCPQCNATGVGMNQGMIRMNIGNKLRTLVKKGLLTLVHEPIKATSSKERPMHESKKNCGDSIAEILKNADPDTIWDLPIVKDNLPVDELKIKYAGMNPGMVRMNIGNRLRGLNKKGTLKTEAVVVE